ncbi:hypothetical protein P7K49_001880 [Saguinus oedipus]|uniref:uridine/cytidine kinase n=1 Tax=Saguinus oedipus TaxID=9490 RepID=A0ABQ9WFR2_SAGOE|nr:hypothetical protein P7K49_001880 [Saguinus oedipus]
MELLGQNEVEQRQRKVVILSQDRFYKVLTAEQKSKALKGQYNFDHPDAFDNDLMHRTLKNIVEGKTVEVPTYDFVTHSRLLETTVVYPADVVLFEGILVFYSQEIRDMFHLRLFVDTDSDVRLSRRGWRRALRSDARLALAAAVLRDVRRGRDLEQILTQYTTFVKPAFEEFCLPVPALAAKSPLSPFTRTHGTQHCERAEVGTPGAPESAHCQDWDLGLGGCVIAAPPGSVSPGCFRPTAVPYNGTGALEGAVLLAASTALSAFLDHGISHLAADRVPVPHLPIAPVTEHLRATRPAVASVSEHLKTTFEGEVLTRTPPLVPYRQRSMLT